MSRPASARGRPPQPARLGPYSAWSRVTAQLVLLALLVFSGLKAAPASACPASLLVSELATLPAGPRSGLHLFARTANHGAEREASWRAIPLEIDPLDTAGRLIFPPPTAPNYLAQAVTPLDLLSFRLGDFGDRLTSKSPPLPCRDAVVYEISETGSRDTGSRDTGSRDTSPRFAYLSNCGEPTARPFLPVVSLDKNLSQLQSPSYQYQFNPLNYMQFLAIRLRTPQGGWQEMARDSRMLIRADVKNFFTLSFASKEIESKLEKSRLGSLSNLAQVSFFLHVLAFEIRMSLSTDVMFFSDSGHIPMMLNLPVDASSYLRPKSGILYSWILSPAALAGKSERQMPLIDPAVVAAGPAALAHQGLAYCGKDKECRYSFGVGSGTQRLSLDFNLARSLVERGFFPLYVPDVGKLHETMGWDMDDQPGAARTGLYFEVSGLREGEHPWDFWLRLGSPGGDADRCPAQLQATRLSAILP